MNSGTAYRDPDARAAKRAQVEAWAATAPTSKLVRTIANPRVDWQVLTYHRPSVSERRIEYVWLTGDLAVPLPILQQIAAEELDARIPPRERTDT